MFKLKSFKCGASALFIHLSICFFHHSHSGYTVSNHSELKRMWNKFVTA